MDKQWQAEKVLYKYDRTLVEVVSNGSERRVRKTLKLSVENRNYAKYELKLMKEITHPHVVKFIDSNESRDTLIVYMTYYENMDLEKFLSSHEVEFSDKVRMFIDILAGMMELHSRYIIHRDIKLKNIFIDSARRCVIGDLGIATKSIDSAKSSVGTIGYNAPEVYSQRFYNEKVDIWALGIIAYQLFNRKRKGKIAFPFLSPQEMRSKIIRFGNMVDFKLYMQFTSKIQPMDEDLPVEIREMILGMLQNDPEKRYDWVQFYRAYHLQKFDKDLRLCTFMAEYKMIQDTKETLKEYNNFFSLQRGKYFFKLRHLLHHQNIEYFKQRYPLVRDNLIHLHIIHFKLMKKTLQRYNYIHLKRIYKYILEWKDFSKAVKNEIHPIEHRINYRLRSDKEVEIRSNTKYLGNEYFHEKLGLVDRILEEIGEGEFKDMKM